MKAQAAGLLMEVNNECRDADDAPVTDGGFAEISN